MSELTEQIPTTQNTIPPTKGKLQNRITLLLVVILIPILVLYAWFTITTQRRNLEALLLERAESTAIAGAAAVETFLDQALDGDELTRDEVFDTDYQAFWEFDPTAYPDFEGNAEDLTKYRTAYDAYTDEHLQELLDSFLGGEDLIFAVASDRNGYVPTHNTNSSTGDGNPVTDRTKRIFDDPVGIKAARNTELILQQTYEQLDTGNTFWDVSAPIYVDGEHWGAFRVGIALTQNQERVITATWQTVFGLGLVILLIAIFSLVVGRYVSAPIVELTGVASQTAAGDFSQQVTIKDRQEITTLAEAFNIMTSQLRGFIENLESRVMARTQDLNLAADIGRQVSQARNIDDVLDEATTSIKDQFDLYQVQIYLTNASRDSLILRASDGFAGSRLLELGHTLPLNDSSLNGYAAYSKQAVIVENTQESDTFRPHPLLPDTRSEMVVPLLVDDDVLGVIDLQSAKVNALSKDTLPAFTVLAGQLSIAILNARRNRDVSQNQRLLRTIIDSTPDWIFVKDQEHRYQLVNQAYASSLNLSPEDFVGKNDIELGFPEEIVKGNPAKGIRGFWADDREIMDSGKTREIPEEPAEVDGQPIVLQTIKAPISDVDGNVTGIVGFVHDITNRKRVEELNQKRAEELQTVAELSTASAGALEEDELLQKTVDLAKERFGLYHVHIYLLDDKKENLVLAAGAGEVGELMRGYSLSLGQEKSLVGRAVRSRKGIIVNDVFQDADFLPNPLLSETRSEMAVPMMVGDTVLGVLDVQADTIDRFAAQDIQIQTTLAAQTAVALQNARQYQQTGAALQTANTFRRLVEASGQAIGIANLQGVISYANPALQQLTAQKEDELIGKPIFPLYPSDIQILLQEEIIPTVIDQGQWQGNLRILRADKEIPTFENYFLLRDEAGNPAQIAGIISDISIQQETERVVRANQAMMRTIIDTTPDWIVVKDMDHNYALVNKSFADSKQMTVEEIIGKNEIDIGYDEEVVKGNPEKGIRGFWPEDEELMENGQIRFFDNELIEVNGEARYKNTTKVPLKNEQGDVTGLVVFANDVTEQRQAQEEQENLARELGEQLAQVNALQRAMTREGWQAFLSNTQRESTGFAYSADKKLQAFNEDNLVSAIGNLPYDINKVEEVSYNPEQTACTLPLQVHGESVGIIGARSIDGNPLTPEQQALLTTLTAQVAETLDRVRLFEETETARSQTEALFLGSQQVVRAENVDEILQAVVHTTTLDSYDRATLMLFDKSLAPGETAKKVMITAVWRKDGQSPLFPVGTEFEVDEYPIISYLNREAPLLIKDLSQDEQLDQNTKSFVFEGLGMKSLLAVPLIIADSWIGFILSYAKDVKNLTEDEVRQIISLAGQAATVTQSQQLYNEARSRAEREQILRQISDRVYAAPDAETVLRTAAREIGQALGLETFIYLEDESQEEENHSETAQ